MTTPMPTLGACGYSLLLVMHLALRRCDPKLELTRCPRPSVSNDARPRQLNISLRLLPSPIKELFTSRWHQVFSRGEVCTFWGSQARYEIQSFQ